MILQLQEPLMFVKPLVDLHEDRREFHVFVKESEMYSNIDVGGVLAIEGAKVLTI